MTTITVTQEDIEQAGQTAALLKLQASWFDNWTPDCPVALAGQRAFGTKDVRVTPETMRVTGGPFEYDDEDFPLPDRAVDWIAEYDASMGGVAEPFAFEVNEVES